MNGIFIIIYLLASVVVGFWASRRVKNSSDFMLAGRGLPVALSTTALFATWFGSETILGAPSTFIEEGLFGIIEDPFGAALCLVLVGVFFAKPIYRLNIVTLSDLLVKRYGPTIEIPSAIMMTLSFFGWVAGQFVALGLILHLILGISVTSSMIICSACVVLYTVVGGMWSVVVTDFVQSFIIILGLIFFAVQVHFEIAPIGEVLTSVPDGFYTMTPQWDFTSLMFYLAAWITIGLGAIPSQDIFQRLLSSKSEQVAQKSAIYGGVMYLLFAMIPLVLALYAKFSLDLSSFDDSQLMLPQLVLTYASPWIQVLFLGALLSAILSTSAGAILAPATVIAENLIKPFYPTISEKDFLLSLRLSVVFVGVISLGMALLRGNIYELVAEASSMSLVCLFVPLVSALWIPKTSTAGVFWSMILGFVSWLISEHVYPIEFPSQIIGLTFSFFGMLIPSILKPKSIP